MISTVIKLADYHPALDTFRDDVLTGLSEDDKQLPCKYFYDERGSRLFDQICELDEYYLTRTELSIMHRRAGEMTRRLGPRCMLIELGSGSSTKTHILLDHLRAPSAYVPVDISREHLRQTARRLSRRYPAVEVLPVCADFFEPFDPPECRAEVRRNVIYFPGSTFGNFAPDQAQQLLALIADLCGEEGGLLIGLDLIKDANELNAAYNDCQGVTEEFNLNILLRINRELDADFDLDQFQHVAFYNPDEQRVEIYLESQSDQTVTIEDEQFTFDEGERIRTEYSHKYDIDQFADQASDTGLCLQQAWTDPNQKFGILYLETS